VKRGLITWDKSEIPPAVFEKRVDRVRRVLVERELSALVVYSELWRSNQARFFSNYMPYFNRALLVIPRDVPPTLLCGLSPRVYGWIRSVTTIEDVRPAGNFAKPLFEIAGERKWSRIGALDFPQFPYDIYKALQARTLEVANVESPVVFVPAEDETEVAMRKKAATLVQRVLDEEMPNGAGKIDYQFVGQLERRLRRAGAEDLIVLLTNGDNVPAPPRGAVLKSGYSVSIAMEYRGHWVRVPDNSEFIWGSYPYEYD
jgi:Xaa-Pro aminopeptidase